MPAALSGDLFAEALSAQADAPRADTEPAAADKAGKELHALRVPPNTVSIRVDGRVDDEAWMGAPVISYFTQEDPDNMMPPTESTRVRVAYDDRYLYVAVRCGASTSAGMCSRAASRTGGWRSRAVVVSGLVTSVSLSASSNVTRELDADASLAGVDATLRRDRNRFNLNGHAVVTHAPIEGVVRNGFGGVAHVDYTTLIRRPSQYDDVGSRGGPPILSSAASWMNVRVESDSRKQWGGSLRFFAFHNRFGGYSTQVEPSVRLQPSQRVVATVGVELTSSLDDAQWIKNTDADADGTEDNVYGTLRRHEVNITTRATYSFTRDMTLEAYLQPFVAVGNYFDIRKLARPRMYDFTPVTLADDPDFNKKSVRGTIVLRWEYVRGSTLFAVWNLATSDEDTREKASTLRGATFEGRSAPPGPIPSRSN